MKSRVLVITLIILSFIGCNKQNQSTEIENSLFWKISGNGLDSPSYLFGTYHKQGGITVFSNFPSFDSLFNSTSQYICESDLSNFDYIPQREFNSIDFLKEWPNPDSTYQNLFTDKQKLILDSAINKNKSLSKLVEMNIRPIIIMDFIETPKSNERKAVRKRVTSPCNLNQVLQSRAVSRKMNIVALESREDLKQINDTLNSHLPTLSYKSEVDFLIYYIQHFETIDSLKFDMEKKMYNTYLAQDIQKLNNIDVNNEYPSKMLSIIGGDDFLKTYKKFVVDERNKNWANKMSELLKDKPSFIAIGAGHLGGENGVVHLLREQGYKVTPVNQDNK